MKCLAIDCNHNVRTHKCKFYRFPRNGKILKAMWIKIARRRPKSGVSRLCSCHFKDGNKKNEPMITIAEESCFAEEVCSPEKYFIQREISSPVLGDRRLESDHPILSTTVNIGPDVPLTCAVKNTETDSFKLSDSSLNAISGTSALIRNGILSASGHTLFPLSRSDHTTDNSVAEESTFSTNESVLEMKQFKIAMKKLYKEKEDIEMERKKERKLFTAAANLWKKEKDALLRAKIQLLAENLILKDEMKNMAEDGVCSEYDDKRH